MGIITYHFMDLVVLGCKKPKELRTFLYYVQFLYVMKHNNYVEFVALCI